jgi:FHA domain
MPSCPAGHDSAATDFCDTCGMRIGAASSAAPSSAAASSGAASSAAVSSGAASSAAVSSGAVSPGAGGPDAPAEACPQCGGSKSGRFCEACGFDFDSGTSPRRTASGPPPSAPPASGPRAAPPVTGPPGSVAPAWTAVVTADRGYFDSVVAVGGPDAATLTFPGYCPERRFTLSGREMRIGRRSVSRGLEPEIDLTGPPEDPGISHLHAVLIAEPDGSWAVLDPGSANGTQVNGADIAAGRRVPVRNGDRICVGAWTVITILQRSRSNI